MLGLFDELNAAGRTVVVITHEHDVAEHAKRVIEMRDGLIVTDERRAPSTGRRRAGADPAAVPVMNLLESAASPCAASPRTSCARR